MNKRRQAVFFATNEFAEANALILKYHYSHRIPSNVQFVGTVHNKGGLFGDLGPAVAACLFSIPPTRWSEPVLELSRLVRTESADVNLTALISDCCKCIKRAGEFDLLVSFADWTQNHHGGIYQACSWNFNGKRMKSCDGLIIDGVFWPGRSCNSTFGTRSAEVLQTLKPNLTIERHFDEGKFLYWKALNRRGEEKAKRLGLQRLAYPKPNLSAIQTMEASND